MFAVLLHSNRLTGDLPSFANFTGLEWLVLMENDSGGHLVLPN